MRFAMPSALSPQPLPQAFSGDVGHDEVDQPTDFLHSMDWHDSGMGEPGGGSGFTQEALAQRPAYGKGRRQELDGDEPVKSDVTCQIDNPHAATAKFALEGVPANERFLQLKKERVEWRRDRHSAPTDRQGWGTVALLQ